MTHYDVYDLHAVHVVTGLQGSVRIFFNSCVNFEN
jgi:hypothetical protein